MRSCIKVAALVAFLFVSQLFAQSDPPLPHPRTRDKGGWIQLKVSGPPHRRGLMQGRALGKYMASQIKGMKKEILHDTGKSWDFFRHHALKVLEPKVPAELHQEMQGIADGACLVGVKVCYGDILLWNGWIELVDDWFPLWQKRQKKKKKSVPQHGHCSAFIATGSYTHDGRIVMGHNTWSFYTTPNHCNVILEVVPEKGAPFVMQTFPGGIHSNTDVYVTGAGLIITETTISRFHGFKEEGTPEFVRIRMAVQYAKSIDDFVATMLKENNGGYANIWLVGDTKTGEIARLDLGLKYHRLQRTKDGFFGAANLPADPRIQMEETTDRRGIEGRLKARIARWRQLKKSWHGKISTTNARLFLADHYDTYLEKYNPCGRCLCGHRELDPDSKPAGSLDAIICDSDLARSLRIWGKWGRVCDIPFNAKDYLKKNPQWAWLSDLLVDLKPHPWVLLTRQSQL